MKTESLRTALEEQSRLEIDLSLLFPTRFGYGLMLGAKVVSLLAATRTSPSGTSA